MNLKQDLIEAVDVAKMKWRPFALTVVLLLAVYAGSLFVPPGPITYALCVPPCVVILLTAIARVNDIGVECMSWRWDVRRIGMVMAGAGAVMVIGAPFTADGWVVPWRAVVLAWGVAFAWFTTPGQEPWEEYILGTYENPGKGPMGHVRHFADRLSGRHRRRGEGDGP